MDAWTSSNHRAYVALSVHLEHEGQPLAMILDIINVAKMHTGTNLAKAFAKVLEDFGISDKMLSVTADNASSNDTLVTKLVDLVPHFAAKSLLHEFDAPKKKGQDGRETDEELNRLIGDIELEDLQTRYEDPDKGADNDDGL